MKINKVAVIGLGHFGASLCEKLSTEGIEILAIDVDEDRVRSVERFVDHPVVLDGQIKSGLASLGLNELDVVVVAIGEDFESSIFTIAHLQELGVKRIIARTMNPVQERIITLMGVKEQILPERDSAYNLANRLSLGMAHAFIEMGSGYGFFEIETPRVFIGKSLSDLKLRDQYSLNLVTLKRRKSNGELEVLGIPDVNEHFLQGDVMVLFGKSASLKKIKD